MIVGMLNTAAAEESILRFNSDIKIHADSSLTVSETIQVRAEGRDIKRGIYRTFPLRRTNSAGSTRTVGFQVLGVYRNGMPEPWHIRRASNTATVYCGTENVFLPPGEHTYRIVYTTTRQIENAGDLDQLYWNVNGTEWSFPTESLSATIHFPRAVAPASVLVTAFTGTHGATGTNYEIMPVRPNGTVVVRTQRPLPPKSNLTVQVRFPKGIITQPSIVSRIVERSRDFGFVLALAGCWLLGVLHYLLAWALVGRDPVGRTSGVRYTPPEGFTPTTLRFIKRMGFDQLNFTVALINMAVKGYLRIEQVGQYYEVSRDHAGTEVLAPEEQVIADAFFEDGLTEVRIGQEHDPRVTRAVSGLKVALDNACKPRYFVNNRMPLVVGALLFLGLPMALVSVSRGLQDWETLMVIPYAILSVATTIVFAFLLKHTTPEGQQVLDETSAFGRALQGRGSNRGVDRALYEQNLPYAIALGYHDDWSKLFTEALREAGQEDVDCTPLWYHGTTHNASAFPAFFTTGFNSALSTSTAPPGSGASGGFSGGGGGGFSGGGGGFSGGGGGGGGGGGW